MDWTAAIERNREALKRILVSLVAMAALNGAAPTLPRRLHRAVLRLLRPAESAARRLIIVMARGIVVPPARPRQAKPKPAIPRRGIGTGIVPPRGASLTPPHQGAGESEASAPGSTVSGEASTTPSPLWGGIEGGGKTAPALALLDPLPRSRRRARPATSGVPRLSVPGYSQPFQITLRLPPSPDDAISAVRLARRLSALAAALADLPAQAKRFARWRARRDRALKTGRVQRFSPLRSGRAYGMRRPHSRRRAHQVDAVLGDLHYFAHCALHGPDTS